ncbi:hypothetical protein AB0935_20925 [Streptomyces sp. NPDC007027]|uniref:hypothetical protein n=1 Tax=Streptomyces sp. NPDC007027 TaxID=3157086 RepID=UPI00345503F3
MTNEAKRIADDAEGRFSRYLKERSYTFVREPDNLGIEKRPDFLISVSKYQLAAEVKAFDTFGILERLEPGQVGARSLKDALKPIRKQIEGAAGQLKGLQGREMPLVVVLDNPVGRPIPMDASMIMSAMYGDLTVHLNGDPNGTATSELVAGRNGQLRNYHPYISAVVVIRREDLAAQWAAKWMDDHLAQFPDFRKGDVKPLVEAFAEAQQYAPEGDVLYVEVFETISEAAVPLPRDVFDGPRDLRWVPNADRTALVPLLRLQEDSYHLGDGPSTAS